MELLQDERRHAATVAWYFHEGAFVDEDIVQRLMYAVQEIGDEVIIIKYVPFDGFDLTLPIDRPVIVYGSINICKASQRKRGQATPVVWADWHMLKCSSYYGQYCLEHLVQQNWAMYPFGVLQKLKHKLYSVYGVNDKIFVRPDGNNKSFAGQLVCYDQFDRFLSFAENEGTRCDEIVVVGQPEDVQLEWRVVIKGGEAVTGSQYHETGGLAISPECPNDVMLFASSLAKVYSPHKIFVMDIARVGQQLRLMEIGAINCAGLYACDVHSIARAMHDVAVEDWQEYFDMA